MRSRVLAAAVLAFGTSLGGCAATTTTSKVAVDYNRIFAQSRNEVLVTNILRAAAREPLQFSTMGTVTGGVRNSGSLTVPLTNLIGGTGGLTISPSTTLNDSVNPNVTIVPLGDKEFTAGVLRPVSLETLNYFLNQGWDPELILMLSVGGIICQTGKSKSLVLNRGLRRYDANGQLVDDSRYDKFVEMFSYSPRLPIQSSGEPDKTVVRMPAKEALALLKDGIGKDRKIDVVEAALDANGQPTTVDVTILKPAGSQLSGFDASEICAEPGSPVTAPLKDDPAIIPMVLQSNDRPRTPDEKQKPPQPDKAFVVLRSVESIIYFLGETQRERWDHSACGSVTGASGDWPYYDRRRPSAKEAERLILFRINLMCGSEPGPFRTFVQTKFNDRYYYVLRSADVTKDDRTLTTLTFLNELIALQTSESTITSSTPVVTIGAK